MNRAGLKLDIRREQHPALLLITKHEARGVKIRRELKLNFEILKCTEMYRIYQIT